MPAKLDEVNDESDGCHIQKASLANGTEGNVLAANPKGKHGELSC